MDNGGPAFPASLDPINTSTKGMSLRDWFAGMALQGMLASFDEEDKAKATESAIADGAYQLADAMLEERKK